MKILKKYVSFIFTLGVVFFLIFLPSILYLSYKVCFLKGINEKNNYVSKENVIAVLKKIKDPETLKSIYESGLVKSIKIKGKDVCVIVSVYRDCPYKIELYLALKLGLERLKNVGRVDVKFENLTYDQYLEVISRSRFKGG